MDIDSKKEGSEPKIGQDKLSTLLKKKKLSKSKKEEPISELKPLEIGFKVESRFDSFRRNFRKNLILLQEELQVSGFFTDIWMWNLVFLNTLAAIVFWIIISLNISKLPESIGLNTNDDRYLDLIVNRNWLFLLPIMHIIFAVIFLFFGFKSQKRLNSLFISSFFQILVVVIFEFLALRSYIVYFL